MELAGLESLEIKIERTGYRPGQYVRGTVILVFNSKENVEGLRIGWRGYADVHWTEEHTRKKGDAVFHYKVDFDSNDNYFEGHVWAFRADKEETEEFAPGRYEYPFKFLLIPELPSSLEGEHGWVRYEVNTVLNSKNSDRKDKKIFKVFANVDLNEIPEAMRPVKLKTSKMMACCPCCMSGPVGFILRLARKGYAIGEDINFKCDLINASDREITIITLALIQNVRFIAGGKEKVTNRTMSRTLREGMPPKSRQVWTGVVPIPKVPPSDKACCEIIKIKYHLVMSMKTTGCGASPEASTSIIVGLIPLGFNADEYSRVPSAASLSLFPAKYHSFTQRQFAKAFAASTSGGDVNRVSVLPPKEQKPKKKKEDPKKSGAPPPANP